MQVAAERGGGHRDFLVVEVVARREADVPAVADAYVAADVEVLRELVGIAHCVVVEALHIIILAHTDAVAEAEAPGQRVYIIWDRFASIAIKTATAMQIRLFFISFDKTDITTIPSFQKKYKLCPKG